MITIETRGNIVEATTDAIVNTVNTVGVMGKGIALQFKKAFPENYEAYRLAVKRKQIEPGRMFVYHTHRAVEPRFIINFPTKRHWKGKSRLSDIELGLKALIAEIRRLGIRSISVPALGCGNGGLDWNVVKPLIESAFGELPNVDVHLYTPHGSPKPALQPVDTLRPRLTEARAAILLLLRRYKIEGYKHSLLEIQKLAYFLQIAGQPLKLDFVKNQYGPYAEKLNFVLQRLEGHYIQGYGDRSQAAEIVLLPGTVDEAESFLRDSAVVERVDAVAHLIEGFETPYGLELLATVHWVMMESALASVDSQIAVSAVQSWNARKKKLLKPSHIDFAWQRLAASRFVGASAAT